MMTVSPFAKGSLLSGFSESCWDLSLVDDEGTVENDFLSGDFVCGVEMGEAGEV